MNCAFCKIDKLATDYYSEGEDFFRLVCRQCRKETLELAHNLFRELPIEERRLWHNKEIFNHTRDIVIPDFFKIPNV